MDGRSQIDKSGDRVISYSLCSKFIQTRILFRDLLLGIYLNISPDGTRSVHVRHNNLTSMLN